MARIYSRKKGKAGSKRPLQAKPVTWVRYDAKELELLIVKLAKEEKTASQIGLMLRDTYGIPDVKPILGKKVLKVLKEHKLSPQIPEELTALLRKNIVVKKHMDENHKDQTAKRGLTIVQSKIRRLMKYYKSKGALPEKWTYDPEKLEQLI